MRTKPDLSGLSVDDVRRFISGDNVDDDTHRKAEARTAPARPEPPSSVAREAAVTKDPDINPPQSPFQPEKKEKPTVQKTFRFPPSLSHALKRRATDESIRTGERVTEVEIVMTAVRQFLGLS